MSKTERLNLIARLGGAKRRAFARCEGTMTETAAHRVMRRLFSAGRKMTA